MTSVGLERELALRQKRAALIAGEVFARDLETSMSAPTN